MWMLGGYVKEQDTGNLGVDILHFNIWDGKLDNDVGLAGFHTCLFQRERT